MWCNRLTCVVRVFLLIGFVAVLTGCGESGMAPLAPSLTRPIPPGRSVRLGVVTVPTPRPADPAPAPVPPVPSAPPPEAPPEAPRTPPDPTSPPAGESGLPCAPGGACGPIAQDCPVVGPRPPDCPEPPGPGQTGADCPMTGPRPPSCPPPPITLREEVHSWRWSNG